MFHRQIGSALKMKSFFNQDLSPSWFIRSRSSRDNKKQKYMLHRNPTIYVKKWKPGNGEMNLSFLETSLCCGHCSANDGQTVYNNGIHVYNGIIHEAGYDHDLVVKQPRGRLGIADLVGLPTPQLAEHPPEKQPSVLSRTSWLQASISYWAEPKGMPKKNFRKILVIVQCKTWLELQCI